MEYIYGMLYKLKSPYPCLVVAGQKHAELSPADTLEIDGNGIVYVYPHARGMWPFCINLAAPLECEHFSIFRQPDATLVILEGRQAVKIVQKENFSFSGKTCAVEVDDQTLSFLFGGKTISVALENEQKFEKCTKIGSFVLAQFENDAYAFCTKTGILSHFGGAVEVTGNRVKVCKKFADSLLRQRNATFVLDGNLRLTEENFVRSRPAFAQTKNSKFDDNFNYLSLNDKFNFDNFNDKLNNDDDFDNKFSNNNFDENNLDIGNANAQIDNADVTMVPYWFMESVLAKDYEYATQFLSEKLSQTIGKSEFAEFFGNFSTFLPLSRLDFITICGKEKNFVRFSLSGNKVDDISIDKL